MKRRTSNENSKAKKAKVVDTTDDHEDILKVMGLLYKPHPWHGVDIGPDAPEECIAYIECVPGEGVKYEVDKETGFLKVDRPQKFSSVCPSIYGFLPQTYCGSGVAERCMEKTKMKNIVGDGDPIDICVLSSCTLNHGDILLACKPIGGFRMIDGGEADDKIIAVLKGDPVMQHWDDVSDIPSSQLAMLKHYFLTYKQHPDSTQSAIVEIPETYNKAEALEMIKRSQDDYKAHYGGLKQASADRILKGLKRSLANSLLSS